MRIIIISLLSISTLATFAQKPWQDYEIDSTEFVEMFGSVEQYSYQKGIERESQHKTLCVWTGAKAYWMYNFAMYLNLENYDVVWDDEQENKIVIEATPKIYSTEKAPMIKVTAPYNEEGKILSAKITGPADDLIHIFIDYWQLSELSMNELKTKRAVVKNFVSDKVSFTWPGADPVITVTKNPNAGIDMFKLN